MIADVRRASFHDGDGIRTAVFFKGCPLSCAWCHNPECIPFEKTELCYPKNCIGCGMCKTGCYSGARVMCGEYVTSSELLMRILADKPYYQHNGGVTFTGGEPLAQKHFLREIIGKCKAEGISAAVETSLYLYDEQVLRSCDLIMADFKIFDDSTHRLYTGVSNVGIMKNLRRVNDLGIPMIVRTPYIPEIDQGIEQISAFLRKLQNVVRYEILPYHPLGLTKAAAMGIVQKRFTPPTKQQIKDINKYAYIRG